jgi:hypothetical protein
MTEENDGFRLHELVYKSDWEKVLLRLKSHPHEALHVVQSRDWLARRNFLFDTNLSALHLACARRNPPRRVIEAFLEAQPQSTKILTYRNMSPLSLACISRARLENISLLATADPDAVLLQDRKGRNVFHHCCAHILTANTLPVLLNAAGPERTTRALLALDRDGKAPIHLACSRNSGVSKSEFSMIVRSTRIQSLNERPLEVLCNEYRENFQSILSFGAIRDSAVSTDYPTPFCNPLQILVPERFWMWRPTDALFLRRCWNMAYTLLGADDNDLATYPLLHECLERDVTCRTDMFHYVLCLNPHYACQLRPSDGTLPLHIIARLAAEDGERHWVERIQILVRLYPKGASIPDQDGNLPLELLTRPTVTFDHVAPVLEASTNSLALLDLPESFYPYILFQLTRIESFTTVYQILRDAPTLAMR